MPEPADNKRIAKNTILLYLRMIVTILIGLYTSRVVIQSLGFEDYGIYNIVGGIVMMLSFLNVGMTGASQRFISYELGAGDLSSQKNVFCTSVLTHNTIALLAVIIMESLGLWLVNYKLVISPERLFAANWVFQCSILSFAVSVISVPFTACVVAHEEMGKFAYISILETVLKLGVALIIKISSFDRLIIYATLLFAVQLSIRLIYSVYCKRKFEECSYKFHLDRKLYKKMIAFAGWGCVGNMGFSLKDQLSNIVLNLFYGTTLNAARGIATQVNSIINGFAGNFTMAMNPQITKQYALGNIDKSKNLALSGSKYAFFLITAITIPFLINEHYLLKLWLGDFPEYTEVFVAIILLSSCVYSLSHTISTAILATGNVKWFQLSLATLMLLEVPVAYFLLRLGYPPYMAALPSVFTNFLSLILRIVLIHRYVPGYSIKEYLCNTVLRCLVIFVIAFIPSHYFRSCFSEGFGTLVLSSVFALMILSALVYSIGFNREEKVFVKNTMRRILKFNNG